MTTLLTHTVARSTRHPKNNAHSIKNLASLEVSCPKIIEISNLSNSQLKICLFVLFSLEIVMNQLKMQFSLIESFWRVDLITIFDLKL